MEGNKYCIRIDKQNRIIKGFSDAFEQPQEGDICINEEGQRHFELFGQINPALTNDQGIALYKWDGEVKQRTAEEIQKDIDDLQPILPSFENLQVEQNVDFDFRLSLIEMELI